MDREQEKELLAFLKDKCEEAKREAEGLRLYYLPMGEA